MDSQVVREKDIISSNINIEDKSNIIYMSFKKKPVYEFCKRVFDVVCSVLALVVLSPFLMVIMLIIFMYDKSNPIYCQSRIGKNQKEFKIYKFRSMYKNADKDELKIREMNGFTDGRMYITEDPRITPIGKIIRKFSIDELPQLINIIKGDMSIIGPRPLVILEHEKLVDNPTFIYRYNVYPGLSCYEQVKTKNEDKEDWISLDYKYVLERSMMTDIKIIFQTVGVVLFHRNH